MSIKPLKNDAAAALPRAVTPSVMQVEASRALPRLSFRFLLIVVTVAAVIAFTLRLAWAGGPVAIAIIYSLAMLAICFGVFAALFLIAWIPAMVGRDPLEGIHLGNPFSVDQLPPQVLPPREPGT